MSKAEGYKDTFVGNLKEGVGKLFGSEKMKSEGREQHIEGHAKRGVAKEREYVEGKTSDPGYRYRKEGTTEAYQEPEYSTRDTTYYDETAEREREYSREREKAALERERNEAIDREHALRTDREWAREREEAAIRGEEPRGSYTVVGGNVVSGEPSTVERRPLEEDIERRPRTEEKSTLGGLGQKIKGSLKETTGKLTGNEKMRYEGAVEKAEGEIRRSGHT